MANNYMYENDEIARYRYNILSKCFFVLDLELGCCNSRFTWELELFVIVKISAINIITVSRRRLKIIPKLLNHTIPSLPPPDDLKMGV